MGNTVHQSNSKDKASKENLTRNVKAFAMNLQNAPESWQFCKERIGVILTRQFRIKGCPRSLSPVT